jgi:hypothetical protein
MSEAVRGAGNGPAAAFTPRSPAVTKTTAYALTKGPMPKGPGLKEGFTAPEEQLQDELSSDRIINLRADAGEQFIDNVRLPDQPGLWIPGYRVITEELARETGLRGLEDDPFPDLGPDQPQPATGAVDGNIVETFVDGVTGQQKNDVLNGCLLAQLAANVRFDRMRLPVEWSNQYGTVLMNIAWVVPTFQFRSVHASGQRFTMDQLILKLVQSLLSPDQISKLTETIDAMKGLEGHDRRFVIFERNSHSQSDGNFQFNSVGTSRDNTLQMKFSAYAFDTNTDVTNVLWFSFSSNSTSLKVSTSTFVLNEQVFARLRDPLLNKLGNRGIDYIGGLNIG